MPVRHGEGNYYADGDTLAAMEANGQVLLRYCDANGFVTPEANPNGSANSIAGVMNEEGTIFGLMPHPEAATESFLGSTDGLLLFEALLQEVAPTRAQTADHGLLDV
jgi:phosphoribosylformylglycinamidine synthase